MINSYVVFRRKILPSFSGQRVKCARRAVAGIRREEKYGRLKVSQ
jgi:hypothetical protein